MQTSVHILSMIAAGSNMKCAFSSYLMISILQTRYFIGQISFRLSSSCSQLQTAPDRKSPRSTSSPLSLIVPKHPFASFALSQRRTVPAILPHSPSSHRSKQNACSFLLPSIKAITKTPANQPTNQPLNQPSRPSTKPSPMTIRAS